LATAWPAASLPVVYHANRHDHPGFITNPAAEGGHQVDGVFDAQFRRIRDAFAGRDVEIDVAYTAAGEVDYIYATGRLLAPPGGDVARLAALLPGLSRVDADQEEQTDLVVLSIDEVEGSPSVPEALDVIDEELGAGEGGPLATPDHVLHIAQKRICPPLEPEVPIGAVTGPWPVPSSPDSSRGDVLIGVSDTGLLQPVRHQWLEGAVGDEDSLGPPLRNGQRRIPHFTGHGTFVAGVASCMAPQARMLVTRDFAMFGAELESVLIAKLRRLMEWSPHVINLSAGTYTRRNRPSLGFERFHGLYPDVTLVAAAGNDSTDRPFFPAAYEWVVAVGALGADQRNRAWFSNYGPWVDVYALGEGIVNAYATGEYTYQEPPKRPAKQTFAGMARWDGTSFAAPIVAGQIAAEIARTGGSSAAAATHVIRTATTIPGLGPAVFVGGTQ
jgi:hypothetical protein